MSELAMVKKGSGNEQSRARDLLQLVTFGLDNEEYAVDILKVREINRLREITKIPNAPHYLDGVINLRGRVIPVINLRSNFGLSHRESDERTRIMIMDMQGLTIGVIVDYVSEVLRISPDIVEPAPAMASEAEGNDFIRGIAKMEDRLVILVDMDSIAGIGAGLHAVDYAHNSMEPV
jgi:purine-binding chemotaxis protein CheW